MCAALCEKASCQNLTHCVLTSCHAVAPLRSQALVVHSTAMSLEALGIDQVPDTTLFSFKHLNLQLNPRGRPALFAFRTTPLSIEELIAAPGGVFGVVAYHGDAEDVQNVDGHHVRDAFQRQLIELIPHFVTFNLDTNVVVTYPEVWHPSLFHWRRLLCAEPCLVPAQVLFITPEEKLQPVLLLARLRLPPYQLAFDTSCNSSSDLRQLYLKVVPDALRTAYNTPDELELLLRQR